MFNRALGRQLFRRCFLGRYLRLGAWTSAVDKELDPFLKIARRSQFAGLRIDFDLLDTRRHIPVAFPLRMFRERDLHEVGPDRQRRVRAGQTELRTVVKPDPHHVTSFGVKPANHPSRDVPVLPARVPFKPRARTFAVPRFTTSFMNESMT